MLGDVRGLPSTCQARALSTHLCVSSGALEGGGGGGAGLPPTKAATNPGKACSSPGDSSRFWSSREPDSVLSM